MNGVGAFILQCKRLEFHYCDWAGSSRGMNQFLKSHISKFARANPSVEISISPRPSKHPVIRGHYINGGEKAICEHRTGVRGIENQNFKKSQNLSSKAILCGPKLMMGPMAWRVQVHEAIDMGSKVSTLLLSRSSLFKSGMHPSSNSLLP
ncbi:putative 60S ribosomal protein L51, mitochondrial [Glarea lozoyensis 74030]|uniref:Large ribosomal subunit protein mL43 n=1 Tax=Glarea lozoyensis (strain ATCC 74030 / MF5533) TaxID=1104152 RepID=H0ELI3_GLAL7|nr:putative 60S ribosomal protein L51, mitochondrial [Glarea lozoyensis 74030]